MNSDATLIAVLADGTVHSGAVLAKQFGITRAAVWKRVARLRAQGLAIDSVAGSGYRMVTPWCALDRAQITQFLNADARRLLGALSVVATVGSTNDELHAHAAALPNFAVLVSEHQTNGRGRRGRGWHSPLGAGLWFSLLARTESGIGAMSGLSLAVAVLVAEALEQAGATRIELKWPNDVWCEGRKLGGILIELAGEWHGPATAVIGIGINAALSKANLMSIDQPATDLGQALGTTPDRNRVLATLINRLLPGIEQFRLLGLVAFSERWQSRDALRGRPVQVDGALNFSGIANGIDPEGRLRVMTPTGEVCVAAGEVSVRTGSTPKAEIASAT